MMNLPRSNDSNDVSNYIPCAVAELCALSLCNYELKFAVLRRPFVCFVQVVISLLVSFFFVPASVSA